MANEPVNPGLPEGARDALKSYNLTLPMGSLSIGVDNIHHDVFLSPKFVQVARDYLFDLIRQNTSGTYLSGIEFRNAKPVDSTQFRKLLTELLQNSLAKAKQQKNIEIDLLFRLAIMKFLSAELVSQFANVILDVKEYIRKRGEYFERSQQAHVIKARLSEMQSARRDVLRIIGQLVAQILVDIEENLVAKARRALFGEDYPYYEMLKNRLVFLDGGRDDFYFLEHYVLLGNYAKDPDRLEAMDAVFQDFLKEAGVQVAPDSAPSKGAGEYRTFFAEAERMRGEVASLEEQRDTLRRKLEKGDGLLNKFLASADPAEVRATLTDVENRLRHFQKQLEEMGPRLDRAKKQAEFVQKDYEGKLGDYLNEPENARRLFDVTNASDGERPSRARLLGLLTARLEQLELIPHLMASYEIRPIASDYCPPVHLQQLRKALVSKEEAKRVEEILKQVPARRLTMKPLEELSRRIRRYSREETQAAVLRFAIDFLRLRRDLRDAEHLAACMERINLVTAEKLRELSRLNNKLYECLLKEEAGASTTRWFRT